LYSHIDHCFCWSYWANCLVLISNITIVKIDKKCFMVIVIQLRKKKKQKKLKNIILNNKIGTRTYTNITYKRQQYSVLCYLLNSLDDTMWTMINFECLGENYNIQIYKFLLYLSLIDARFRSINAYYIDLHPMNIILGQRMKYFETRCVYFDLFHFWDHGRHKKKFHVF